MAGCAQILNSLSAHLANFELSVFHFVNGSCGTSVLDWLAWFAQGDNFARGGLIMAAYWWFWFVPGQRDNRRRAILSALIGAILALIIVRVLASTLPYRTRPLYATGINYRSPVLPKVHDLDMEDWSSFPSDQAAVFFALAFGLFRLSRPVGTAAMLFVAIWVGLVRIYLGMHYPFDVVAGSVIGVACVSLVRKTESRLTSSILAFEQQFPQVFYTMAFLFTFEISVVFDDIRRFLRGLVLLLHASGYDRVNFSGALALVAGAALLVGLSVAMLLRILKR